MPQQVAGFPYWELSFDADGNQANPQEFSALQRELPAQSLTDLFIFSHGWNNDRQMARNLYAQYFDQMRQVLARPGTRPNRAAKIGTVGIIWPSMRWADETIPTARGGGAASVSPEQPDAALVQALKTVFTDPHQQQALDGLAQLLTERPRSNQALEQFQEMMRQLATTPQAVAAPEDNGEEQGLLNEPAEDVFDRFADVAQPDVRAGGAVSLGDVFDRLWAGAKEALRGATYWQMKQRAGVVGKTGLGPAIAALHAAQPDLRIHLIGHSFGGRLVSFALSGLPNNAGPSPVKSVVLVQGAFSHFAFADALPFDRGRSGALKGVLQRVDGPVVVTHSDKDLAVGNLYPLGSIAGHDDAAALGDDVEFRWGAMGFDGAHAVQAANLTLGAVGQKYPFGVGAVINVDASQIIATGDPPSGAHSDIFHPELAWITLAAAGIV